MGISYPIHTTNIQRKRPSQSRLGTLNRLGPGEVREMVNYPVSSVSCSSHNSGTENSLLMLIVPVIMGGSDMLKLLLNAGHL